MADQTPDRTNDSQPAVVPAALTPALADQVAHFFRVATFVHDMGVRFVACGPGWCETTLAVQPRHAQQDGFVHAGVLATLADHTAGGAAGTCARLDQGVLSIEFKINLLRPALGPDLRCRAVVLRPGKSVTVAEAEVYDVRPAGEVMVAKATVTLAVVQRG